jgi:hypothetical protein
MSRPHSLAISLMAAIVFGVQPLTAQEPAAATSRLGRLLLQIGADDGPVHETFVRIAGVATSSSGLLFVLDGGEQVVRVYGPDGAYRFSFGRSGGGPGEFVRPSRIVVDSVVHIFDEGQRRVSLFGLDGQLRDTRQLPDLGGINLTMLQRLVDGSYIGTTTPRFSVGHASHAPDITVIRLAPGSSRPDTLISYHSGGVAWVNEDRPGHWGLAPSGLGAGGGWALLGDSVIATVDGYGGSISWYRVGRDGISLAERRSLGLRGADIAAADVRAAERQIRESRPDRLGKLRLIMPPKRTAAIRALFGDDGTLWVRTPPEDRPGDVRVWLGFRRGQATPTRLALPDGFDLHLVRAGRVYGNARTPLGSPVLRVYELVQR